MYVTLQNYYILYGPQRKEKMEQQAKRHIKALKCTVLTY